MFKKNPRHVQPYLISNVNDLPEKQRLRLEKSWSGTFFREFYSRVDEQAFAELYVDFPSRPNAPINELVSLEFLKDGNGWTDEEMYEHYLFDLQTRHALGLDQLGEEHFELRTVSFENLAAVSAWGASEAIFVPRKLRISSRKRGQAGSSANKMWLSPSRGTKRALGMRAASRNPASKGTMASLRTWKTRVGAFTLGARSRTSSSWKALHRRTALCGETVRRSNSANQRC